MNVRYFLLTFQYLRSSLSMYEAQFCFRWLNEKLYLCDSSSNFLDFFAACFEVPKSMIALKVFLCTGQIYDFNFRELLVYFEFRRSSQSAMSFFYLLCCWASLKPITGVEFKFVARQVVASVVIRAAKLKFVAESRTLFAQHVAPTCNIVICCETSWSQTW